jgi:hypothetical protein
LFFLKLSSARAGSFASERNVSEPARRQSLGQSSCHVLLGLGKCHAKKEKIKLFLYLTLQKLLLFGKKMFNNFTDVGAGILQKRWVNVIIDRINRPLKIDQCKS